MFPGNWTNMDVESNNRQGEVRKTNDRRKGSHVPDIVEPFLKNWLPWLL